MQRIAVILLVMLAVACHKEELPTQELSQEQTGKVLSVKQLQAVKFRVNNLVQSDISAQLDWDKTSRIEKKGRLLAVKVPLKDIKPDNYHFLIVNMDKNGNPATVSRNIVKYQSKFGLDRFPVFVLNQNYATGKTNEFHVSGNLGNGNGDGRQARRLSLDYPGTTLPMVTVIGTYSNGSTGTTLSGSTAYVLAAMLGIDGSSGSSGDGSGNGDQADSYYTNLDYIDPMGDGGGGGTTESDPTPVVITWEIDESDQKPAIELEQYLKCFDNIPDAGASYQVKVYVDIPVNQTPEVLLGTSPNTGEFGPGHVFMKLTKFNGSQQVSQVIGFYPANGLKSATMNAVPSKMVNDGNSQGIQHEFNASLSMGNWTGEEFKRLLNEIRGNSSRPYELDQFNCANFVASSINAVKPGTIDSDGVLVYDPTNSLFNNTMVPFSPNGMYKALARQKYSDGPYANNIDVGVNLKAQPSNGPCN